jgi:hypothetical protein
MIYTHNNTRRIYGFHYTLKYLCTYSMEHSPPWKANRFSASQEIPRILWNRNFITVFTSAHHLSLTYQSMPEAFLVHIS